jgi:small-conductance mechanosensitive channel
MEANPLMRVANALSVGPGNAVLEVTPEGIENVLDASTIFGAIAVLFVAYLGAKLLSSGLSLVAERSSSRRITIKMFVPIVKLLVYAIALYVIFVPVLDLGAAQLLAVSGLIGAAIGFGLQDLVSGIFGGLVLITERPYQVGDKVTIDGQYGEVGDIGLRSTAIQTPGDSTVVVQNDQLFQSSIVNANSGNPEMLVTVDLAIASEAETEEAMQIVEEALITSQYVYIDADHRPRVRVADEITHQRIRGRAYVADHRDERAFASDVTRRARAAFERLGIEMPDLPARIDAD